MRIGVSRIYKSDIVVIGAGYWGRAITLELQRISKSVLCVDSMDPRAGSINASGICDPSAYTSSVFTKYWPQDWTKSDLQYSLNWLLENGGEYTQERFWNKFGNREPRLGERCIYVAPIGKYLPIEGILIDTVYRCNIEGIIQLQTLTGKLLECMQVVVCAGYQTDKVLESMGIPCIGVTGLWGRGLVVDGVPKAHIPVSVMVKPYRKYTIRKWATGYRVGDSAGEDSDNKRLREIQSVVDMTLINPVTVSVVNGYRPVTEKFIVEKVSPNVVVATGGHRLGLGLSGLVAKKVVEMLK